MSILHLEPQVVWQNFVALNQIPRPSKKEEKVIKFIKTFGERLNLETQVDAVGNVLIKKPATPTMQNRKCIALQSHLDMVCQKNNEIVFDFDTQGIEMYIDGDWVKAKGTTLGADNGMGVAAMMAILQSNTIEHPEIEALFTIDEETGMTGAKGLQSHFLNAEILLNLDTEEDDEIDIGCAGGIDISAHKTFQTYPSDGIGIEIFVKGLQGGHSGMDIHKGFGNANKLLARLLNGISDVQLVSIDGGGLRNAIPREAKAVVVVKHLEISTNQLEAIKKEIFTEFSSLEPNLSIEINTINDKIQNAFSSADSLQIVQVLAALHNGVYRMSPEVSDLVEASNNVARVVLNNDILEIKCLTRSSVESSKKDVQNQLSSVFQLAGMHVVADGSYPGWKPLPGSEIVQILQKVYTEKFGESPKVVACHAGLECGIIGAAYPKMQMVSFGPNIRGAHSPDEKVSISSVQKFWSYLQEILKQIPTKN